MLPTKQYLFHPFKDSLIGIFETELLPAENVTGFVLKDIDLYYQPLLEPEVATIFTCIQIPLLFHGIYIHLKIIKNLKKENSMLKDISRVFVYAQLVYWPFVFFLICLTNFLHPLNQLIGQWFCTFADIFSKFLLMIVLFHSFLAALMRYTFIIHSTRVRVYGKENVKKIFFFMSIFLPSIITIWRLTARTLRYGLSYINKCNGLHHESFLVDIDKHVREVEDYNEVDSYTATILWIRKLAHIGNNIAMLLFGSNVIEGIIYFRLFSYMNRYQLG